MKINNVSFQNFKGIYIHEPEMTQRQINYSYDIADAFEYSDAYQNSKYDVDVCFLPSTEGVKIKFVDKMNDSFVKKNGRNTIVKTFNRDRNGRHAPADWVIDILERFTNGEFTRPDPSVKRVINKETDAAKLKPKMYDEIDLLMQEAINLLGYKEDSKEVKEYVTKRFFDDCHSNASGEFDRGLGCEYY